MAKNYLRFALLLGSVFLCSGALVLLWRAGSSPAIAGDVLIDGEAKITLAPRPDDVELRDSIRSVQKVVDGDTIIVRWNDHVRLIGVDAPEIDGPYGKGEYFGGEAKAYLESLLDGQKVLIKFDPQNIKTAHKDKYGRLLGYVYLTDGTFINALLIENGYAATMRYFEYERKVEFMQLEEKAKVGGRGIWREIAK